MTNHLTPENFYHFIDGRLEGHILGRVESPFAECPECLETLAMIVRGPWTAEEGAALGKLPQRSPEEILGRLKPLIAKSWKR